MLEAPAFHFSVASDQSSILPASLAALSFHPQQNAGSDPLTDVLDAMVREVDGDGVLAVWHPNSGSPEAVVATGACAFNAAHFEPVANATLEVVQRQSGGARSYWRALGDDTGLGLLIATMPVEGGTMYVSSFFGQVERTTRMRAGQALARIIPLVHPFFRSWSARGVSEDTLKGAVAALQNSGVGIILVGRDGQVLFANSSATQVLESGDGLRRKGQQLRGNALVDTMKLSAAIDHVITKSRESPATLERVVVRLDRANGHPLMVTVLATESGADAGASAAAVLYLKDPDRDIRSLIQPICKLYGMSPAEIRLACELSMGRSLAEAAHEIRVREATARSYLKQLFQKTGTHRQVELVRLLISGAIGEVSDASRRAR